MIKQMVIIFFMVNLAFGALGAAGFDSAYGTNEELGVEESMNDTRNAAQDMESKRTSLSDSFSGGMIASIGKLTSLDDSLFAIPVALANLGFPGFLIDLFTGPLYVVAAFEIAEYVRGYSLS